jgi:serine acetyltransferase
MTIAYKGWTPQLDKNAWIAEGATVIGRTQMGEDSAVWFGCVVRGDVHYIKIGARSNIQDLSMVHVTHHKKDDMSDGNPTIIGDDVLIYQQVTLGGVSLSHGKRHPTIEDNVVIGTGAKILGNITIGKGAKIGANSVVVKDVPPHATAVGVPARIISNCGNQNKLRHDILPDVNREIFHYLIKRIAVLEESVKTGNMELMEKEDHELTEIYATFIKSM